MKKTYFAPEMEIVDIKANQQLLAGSAPALGVNLDSSEPILSPEFDEELELFGF